MAGIKISAAVVTLICIVILAGTGESGPCPSGQMAHTLPNGSTRCCIPWPYTCPINYPYTICDKDGGSDVCRKCPSGFIQPSLSNSTHPNSCFKNRPICSSEDKVPSNRMEILRRMRPSCVCDRANNYYPVMGGISCDFKPRGCPKGRELQEDGTCGECPLGTYKDRSGYGLCKPWTNCESKRLSSRLNGTASRDAECQQRRGLLKTIPKRVLSVIRMNTTSGSPPVMHAGKSQLPGEFGFVHFTLLALLLPIGFLGMTVLVLYMVKQAAVNIGCGQKKARLPEITEPEACVPLQHQTLSEGVPINTDIG